MEDDLPDSSKLILLEDIIELLDLEPSNGLMCMRMTSEERDRSDELVIYNRDTNQFEYKYGEKWRPCISIEDLKNQTGILH